MSGDDSLTLPLMAIGGTGVISVASNIIPDQMRTLTDLAAAGKFAEARAVHLRLFPLFRALFVETNPIGIKTALQLLGRDTGELRLPMCAAQPLTRKLIQQALCNAGLLAEGAA
jgi:4-hydroxy-tetrahydrodipicolinate synthase